MRDTSAETQVGQTGDPAERRRRRRGILQADRMFHVTDDSYTSSIKMKLIMKSFILQVSFIK